MTLGWRPGAGTRAAKAYHHRQLHCRSAACECRLVHSLGGDQTYGRIQRRASNDGARSVSRRGGGACLPGEWAIGVNVGSLCSGTNRRPERNGAKMTTDVAMGIAGVLAGGVLNGSFVAPMKRLREWRWENTWLVYSVAGLLVIPWIVASLAVPQLGAVFQSSSWTVIGEVVLFGLGWGAGSVLFGLGVDRMGLAVGYGLILGLIAPIGTFLPLAVLHPERLYTRQGATLAMGTAIVLAGIVLCALAGRIREQAHTTRAVRGGNFFTALLILRARRHLLSDAQLQLHLRSRAAGAGTQSRCRCRAGVKRYLVANADRRVSGERGLLRRAAQPQPHVGSLPAWRCESLAGRKPDGSDLLRQLHGLRHGRHETRSAGRYRRLAFVHGYGADHVEWARRVERRVRGAPRRAWLLALGGIALLIVAITIIAQGGNA